MRYYNYINENLLYQKEQELKETFIQSLKKDRVFDELKRNDFIKLYIKNPKHILYRGSKKNINIYEIIKSKTERKPKDMPQYLHEEFDYAFNRKFGWKARSEGVFTTKHFGMAGGYGKPYVFIPLGNYKFVYSDKIKDLYCEIFEGDLNYITDIEAAVLGQNEYDVNYLSKQYSEIPSYNDIIYKIINSYSDKNIIKAIESEHEVVFKCDRFILFDEHLFKQNYHIFK